MKLLRVQDSSTPPRGGYAAQLDLSTIEGLFIAKVMIPLLGNLLPYAVQTLGVAPAGSVLTRASSGGTGLPNFSLATGDWLIVWDDGTYDVSPLSMGALNATPV